ncbi:hypothetical protein KW805_00335 [Candidatus Pacearchaeota archaeon]|nr:hypothetical protein [Candidatus Pacearchaeota archaeon]
MRFDKKGLFVILLVLFVIPMAAAEVSFTQPNSLYSKGDTLTLSATMDAANTVSDYLSLKLFCGAAELELYRSPYTLQAGETKTIPLSITLDSALIGEMGGECFLRVEWDEAAHDTQTFLISKGIDVLVEVNGSVFSPGETISLSGTAIKGNSAGLEGYASVFLEPLNISFLTAVHAGAFNMVITIPGDAIPGNYVAQINAYEKDSSSQIINTGDATTFFRVRQLVRSSDIALSTVSVIPGEELTYTALLYDQSGAPATGDIGIALSDPRGTSVFRGIARAGDAQAYKLESNATPGNWKISANFGNFLVTKSFSVEEHEEALFIRDNNTISILNIGNVPYHKLVELSIGDTKEVRDISLEVGESKRYSLYAPRGEYSIQVQDGQKSTSLGVASLTGRAISVQDLEALDPGSTYFWIAFIIIVLVAIIVIAIIRRVRRPRLGNTYVAPPVSTRPMGQPIMVPKTEKVDSAVVCLKVKNIANLSGTADALAAVDKALVRARGLGAKIYLDGAYRVMVFSPALIKEDIVIQALSAASDIEATLLEYNKYHSQKIEFGISVHKGDLIAESSEGKVKFSSWGNTLPAAKNFAEYASNDIFISEFVRNKALGKIKAELVEGRNLWRLIKVIDRDRHKEFVSRFVDRQRGFKS